MFTSKSCESCGRPFRYFFTNSDSDWRQRYCGYACFREVRQKEKPKFQRFNKTQAIEAVSCWGCGKEIQVGQFIVQRSQGPKKNRLCCSKPCTYNRGHTARERKKSKSISGMKWIASNARSEDFYLDGRWRVLRYQVLAERGARCEACGRTPAHGVTIHVDHIKPRQFYPELSYTKTNLQVLCEDCNKGKGAWDETDWRIEHRTN